jgi:hypothetical protein
MQDVPATDATTITAISLMVGAAKSDPEVRETMLFFVSCTSHVTVPCCHRHLTHGGGSKE